MTTSPVMSLTDELVAELEALAGECGQHGTIWYEPCHMAEFLEYDCDRDFVIAASPATILALLSERAEMQQQLRAAMISVDNCELFRKDAERMDWLADPDNGIGNVQLPTDCVLQNVHSLRAAIDAAMQLEQKQ